MKKVASVAFSVLFTVVFASSSFAQTLTLAYDGKTYKYSGGIYDLKVNGELVPTDVPVIIMNGRSMVPVRALFEKLGADVNWNSKLQKMSISYNGSKIELQANKTNAKIDGKEVQLDVPPKKINDRLMFPVASMKEQLNVQVGWFPDKQLLTIDTFGNLDGVNFSQLDGVDVVTINVERYGAYNIMRLSNPDRLVIDFSNTKAPDKEIKVDTKGIFVKSVRYCSLNQKNARVVLDMNGQQQYTVEEKKGQLIIKVEKPTYRNIEYKNNGDRIGFLLKGAKLTEGDSKLIKHYSEEFDSSGNKYTITFPSNLANIGYGVMKINDSTLDSIEIITNPDTKKTTMVFNAKSRFFYEIVTRPDAGDTAITIFKPAAKGDKLVVIDPGHGGKDPGAIYGSTYEKDLNLDIAVRLNKLLKSKNVKTYIIREDDSYIGLYERAFIANDLNAKLFLSIHNNALNDPGYGGTMTLYRASVGKNWPISGQRFAQIIQGNLLSVLKTKDRKIIERPNLVVLKYTNMPAALAEVAFLTNKQDRQNLLTEKFRQKAAEALGNAILQALKEVK